MPGHKFTDKNHYNPCFWTAHWNPEYFRAVRLNLKRRKAREATIFALSVKANKIFETALQKMCTTTNTWGLRTLPLRR